MSSNSNFGQLVLVLGDMHIPDRASKIPAKFQSMLVPNKMQHVLCTGNVSRESRTMLQGLAPNVHAVRGAFDDDDSLPETRVVQVGAFRIGVIHGQAKQSTQASQAFLQRMRRQLNVDILVSGSTHQNRVAVENECHYFINPVSTNITRTRSIRRQCDTSMSIDHSQVLLLNCFTLYHQGSITGASTVLTEEVVPSFILLAVQDTKVVCYVYELVNDEVSVSKTEFVKRNELDPDKEAATAHNAQLMASLLA